MDKSTIITDHQTSARSSLIRAINSGFDELEAYVTKPQGVFNRVAKIIGETVTINSNELDLEFNVKFDDDMEANEAEIIVYNLSSNTINQFKNKSQISIEAGYGTDIGVLFSGYITKVKTRYEDADKVTTIKCIDDVSEKSIEETTYASGTTASYILKDLLSKTGMPIAVFEMRRDWTYTNDVKVDGDLMENIKQYSEVCGVSTYINKGKIYCRYIKEGDNLYFELSETTGLIGSPESFEEEKNVEDFSEVINGYECESLLQHRFAAGGIVKLTSLEVNGTYRICSGEHIFNSNEAISKIKIY